MDLQHRRGRFSGVGLGQLLSSHAAQHLAAFRRSCADGVPGVAFPLRRGAEARSTRERRSHKENRQECR